MIIGYMVWTGEKGLSVKQRKHGHSSWNGKACSLKAPYNKLLKRFF